jgi:hypothetical protein
MSVLREYSHRGLNHCLVAAAGSHLVEDLIYLHRDTRIQFTILKICWLLPLPAGASSKTSNNCAKALSFLKEAVTERLFERKTTPGRPNRASANSQAIVRVQRP